SRRVRRTGGAALPVCPPLRLRRLAGDGGPLPRALRRARDHRRGRDPAGALGHVPGRDAGTRLAGRRSSGMSSDPVSWFMIEAGWKVLDADGQEVGSVDEVAGDSSDDIFNGLSISTSLLGKPRYVPSEQVGAITDGHVQLKLSKVEIERLGEFD